MSPQERLKCYSFLGLAATPDVQLILRVNEVYRFSVSRFHRDMITVFLTGLITSVPVVVFSNSQSILTSFEIWSFRSREGKHGKAPFHESQKYPGLNIVFDPMSRLE
jgi:hypothetical protein